MKTYINKLKYFIRTTLYSSVPAFLPKFRRVSFRKVGISTLFYHRGVDISIYSIKSFFYQIGYPLRIFGINDGTLTPMDIKKLHSHFDLTLVDPKHSEVKMKKLLLNYTDFLKYRSSPYSPYTKFKFDSILLSPFDRLIYIDGDILFRKSPREIKEWISSDRQDFLCLGHDRNYLGSYKRDDLDYSFRVLLAKYKYKVISPSFNAGILCIPKKNKINLARLNEILGFFNSVGYSNTIYSEETAFSIIYKDLGGKVLPIKKYACPVTFSEYKKAVTNDITMLHYIGESKQYFERDALRLVFKEKFFRS